MPELLGTTPVKSPMCLTLINARVAGYDTCKESYVFNPDKCPSFPGTTPVKSPMCLTLINALVPGYDTCKESYVFNPDKCPSSRVRHL